MSECGKAFAFENKKTYILLGMDRELGLIQKEMVT